MEIEHALLSPMQRIVDGKAEIPVPVDHALFFFRSDPFREGKLTKAQKDIYTNAKEDDPDAANTELENFKKRVRYSWPGIYDYDCTWDASLATPELNTEGVDAAQGRLTGFSVNGRPLKEVLIAGLKKEIQNEFPDNIDAVEDIPLEMDLQQQSVFLEINCEGFIERPGVFAELDAYMTGNNDVPFVLTSPSGLGKTMLLANFAKCKRNGGRRVIARFCGASDMANSLYGLWCSILGEAGIMPPDTWEDLQIELPIFILKNTTGYACGIL